MDERELRKIERDSLLRRLNNEDSKAMNIAKLKQLSRMPRYSDEQIGRKFRELERIGAI